MPFHFCPHCGTKLQPLFRFCPSCGEKLPCPGDTSGPVGTTTCSSVSSLKSDEIETPTTCEATESLDCTSSIPVSVRPPLRKPRNSIHLKSPTQGPTPPVVSFANPVTDNGVGSRISPVKPLTGTLKLKDEVEPALESSSLPVSKFPRPFRGKAKSPRPVQKQVEEGKKLPDKTSSKVEEPMVDCSSLPVSSPVSPPISRSPSVVKGKAKKAKRVSAVKPLEEEEELTDTTGRKWKLVKLLSQSTTELIYQVSPSNSKNSQHEHILKLGAKDGRIFNEQNFLQRAAKPSSVDKWMKRTKMGFLGIPVCIGFGLHADSYRFLIFPSMGQTLQSIMEEEELLSENAILQIACRIIDVLEYIHSNEYVHADIHAENIFIKPGEQSQVYLVGYCHAFRYCPGGKHVEYREASRTQHEGAIDFISLDSHKGAGPSRRSDLQSLSYCMLQWHTGTLPWTSLSDPDQVAKEKQRYMEDVPALLHHCFGNKRVSSALQAYLTEVMALHYSEQPDYTALKAGLSAALLQLGGSLQQPLSL